MKRLVILVLLAVGLCACSNQAEYETLSDNLQYDLAEPADISVSLPDDLVLSVFSSNNGNEIYIDNDYTVETYLLPAGDMEKTVQVVTGFEMDDIRIVKTESDGIKRYECIWTSAGEGELQSCRATILDDGNFHYVLTVIGDQSAASECSEEWSQIFKSYMLTSIEK